MGHGCLLSVSLKSSSPIKIGIRLSGAVPDRGFHWSESAPLPSIKVPYLSLVGYTLGTASDLSDIVASGASPDSPLGHYLSEMLHVSLIALMWILLFIIERWPGKSLQKTKVS